ncbi:MAG: ATP/GTP phosphatase [Dehalococcoidia bacterium]|nr:ATP/GTP phosphatase [Chloroflexota bacterium]
MIGKIRITNYKSLRNVDIELGKFNVLVGPNASGKSNFLDSLAFLSETAQNPITAAFSPRGGFKRVVFGGDKGGIEFCLEIALDEELYSYTICVGESEGIEAEQLKVGDKVVIARGIGDRVRIMSRDGTSAESEILYNYSTVYDYGRRRGYPHIPYFQEYLSSWRLYQTITSGMRKTLPTQKSFALEESGGNLAQVLLSLHNERPRVFRRVEEILRQGIPKIEELLTPLTEDGQTFVALREEGFADKFDYYQISDGTLNLLFYITAIAFPETKLLCFEEPENFVHARLQQLLVEILKNSGKQIVVSTHSLSLLDCVEPEDVIVVEKEGNETKVRRVENGADLKKRLQDLELGLGEYYYSGAIGGVP